MLPYTRRQHDCIWVSVDRLTKLAHFVSIKVTFSAEDYAKLYLKDILKLNGAPLSIISDRVLQFTSNFCKDFESGIGTKVKLSSVFHPKMDGQAEHTINALEDNFRACVIDLKGNWDDKLPLIQFSYNNSYHSTISMAPLEAHYGMKCRSLVCGMR